MIWTVGDRQSRPLDHDGRCACEARDAGVGRSYRWCTNGCGGPPLCVEAEIAGPSYSHFGRRRAAAHKVLLPRKSSPRSGESPRLPPEYAVHWLMPVDAPEDPHGLLGDRSKCSHRPRGLHRAGCPSRTGHWPHRLTRQRVNQRQVGPRPAPQREELMSVTPHPPTAGDGRNNSSSLRRALDILFHLAGPTAASGMTLSELAEDLSVNKSTASRLLAPLTEARLVERDESTGGYRLGSRTAQLGQIYLERLDLRAAARESLIGLVEATGETVHLVIADLPEVVYVDKFDSPQSVRMYSRIGNRMPAYSTSVGKAILAHANENAVAAVIDHGMPRRTDTTHTTAQGLRADLAVIRELGYAVDNSENEPDIRCVAAPIFDHNDVVTSAISASGPANRVTPERESHLGVLVISAADRISRLLGAHR